MSDDTPDWDHPDIPPPPPRLDQPRRGSSGMYTRPRNQPERDAWAAARWTIDGWTLQDIAHALGVTSKGTAHEYVQRGLRSVREATAATAEQARAAHRARLGYALEVATEVMGRDHQHVAHGKVVTGDDGKPVLDDAPKLAAAGKVKELSESLRKLDGLDQPAKVEHSGSVTYEVVGVDPTELT